ncbi:hypothetical protein SFR_1267 [Streptomyces sp. FR-008]|nr:hypothetical protein SFR_1267 [Streptomyces sp. FR-008]
MAAARLALRRPRRLRTRSAGTGMVALIPRLRRQERLLRES